MLGTLLLSLQMSLNPICFSEEIVETQVQENNIIEESNYVTYPNEDAYEHNDQPNNATNLNINEHFTTHNYEIQIDATLDVDSCVADYDYYYFTILSDSTVEISISSTSMEYDFFVFTYDYNGISNNHSGKELVYIYAGESNSSLNHSYVGEFKAGTYILCARGLQYIYSYMTIEYSLDIRVDKQPNGYNANVSKLLEEDGIGAVWIADYIPFGYIPSFISREQICYYTEGDDYPDYGLETIRNLTNGEPIHAMTYYIWDSSMKNVLHKLIYEYMVRISHELEEEEASIQKFELIKNDISKGIDVFVWIAGNCFNVGFVPIAAEILSNISEPVVNLIFNSIMPTRSMTSSEAANYGAMLGRLMERFGNTDSNEIIYIPVYFDLTVDPGGMSLAKHYVSYAVTCDAIMSYHPNALVLSADDVIYSNHDMPYFCNGKIYTYQNMDIFSSPQDLVEIDGRYTHYHEYNYRYLIKDTRTHYAVCECGEVKEQGHAVLQNSKVCILCGGRVEMAFQPLDVNLNSVLITKNGSYFSSDGIIILVESDIDEFYNGCLIFYKKEENSIK